MSNMSSTSHRSTPWHESVDDDQRYEDDNYNGGNGYDDDNDDDDDDEDDDDNDDDDSSLSARQACRVWLIVLGMGPRHGLPHMGQLGSMQAMPHHLLKRPPPVNASKN